MVLYIGCEKVKPWKLTRDDVKDEKATKAGLAKFMRDAIADYAIPRREMNAAGERDFKFKSSSAVAALHHEAKSVFTDLSNTGEGGEMLLYLLAERFRGLPQVLCKMDLKTDSHMHYHRADDVYARVSEQGLLKLFWGRIKSIC